MPVVYRFSAKSIQSYIFHSSELKDMVAASEQLEQLTETLLDNVLKTLQLTPETSNFLRRAGGAFIVALPDSETAKRLRDVWSFVVRRRFPGLSFSQEIRHCTHFEALEDASPVHSILCPQLPLAGPLVARSPRLGEAAVDEEKSEEGTERLDAGAKQKRDFLKRMGDNSLLGDKFSLKAGKNMEVSWPRHLERRQGEDCKEHHLFPLLGDNRYVGVIHADGNGFGEMMSRVKARLKTLPDDKRAALIYRALSDSISKISRQAAQAAAKTLVGHERDVEHYKVMPARPLILGGEDLSIIVRADLAIPFTRVYLKEFEEASERALKKLDEEYQEILGKALKKKTDEPVFPKILTACAGIAFIKASQPFHQAHALAESLCGYAKQHSKKYRNDKNKIPASLAFHRITTSMIDQYADIRANELQTADGWETAMQPYAVGSLGHSGQLPELNDLRQLCEALSDQNLSRGAVRELMNLLHLSPERSRQAFGRWRENMDKAGQAEASAEILEIMRNLVPDAHQDLPILDRQGRTPLGDALAWLAVSKGADHE